MRTPQSFLLHAKKVDLPVAQRDLSDGQKTVETTQVLYVEVYVLVMQELHISNCADQRADR